VARNYHGQGTIDLILAPQGNLEHFFLNRARRPAEGNTKPTAQLLEPTEGCMSKSLIAIAGALVVVSAGSLMADRAEAGASASAPTKYSQASVAGYQTFTTWRARRVTGTSEYSASSKARRR